MTKFTVSDRGFTHMDPVLSDYGGHVRVYESSAAMHPHIWLTVTSPVDLNHPEGEMKAAVAHLRLEDAVTLAEQLLYLIVNHYQHE